MDIRNIEKSNPDEGNTFCLKIINGCFINGIETEKEIHNNIKIWEKSKEIKANILGDARDYNNVWDNPCRYGDTFKDYKKGDKNDNNVEKTSNHGLKNNDI